MSGDQKEASDGEDVGMGGRGRMWERDKCSLYLRKDVTNESVFEIMALE